MAVHVIKYEFKQRYNGSAMHITIPGKASAGCKSPKMPEEKAKGARDLQKVGREREKVVGIHRMMCLIRSRGRGFIPEAKSFLSAYCACYLPVQQGVAS